MEDKRPKPRKPWVIFVTNQRELGRSIKLIARRKEGQYTLSRRRALKFKTRQDAANHLRAMERKPGKSYEPREL